MRQLKVWLAIGVAVVCLGLAVWMWQARQQTPPAQVQKTPAPESVTIKASGNYANDWMANCGPLSGPAQKECEARLDTAYGKSDATPVPVAR